MKFYNWIRGGKGKGKGCECEVTGKYGSFRRISGSRQRQKREDREKNFLLNLNGVFDNVITFFIISIIVLTFADT